MDNANPEQVPAPRREIPWRSLLIGIVATAVLVTVVVMTAMHQARPEGVADEAYAPHVAFTNLRVAAADTMMAGSVTYVDGTVTNSGDRTITALSAGLTFFNIEGQVVQSERSPIVTARTGSLRPHQARNFRVGFDHISADWNQAAPQIKAAGIFVK
jgi:hypothetical protein